jgi:ABC-type polysaccharide/polyol phosphate export permease
MLSIFLENKYLIHELVSRDVRSRYVGSILGLFWSVLNPLLQLILYTVVFSVILDIRFGEKASAGRFAEYLFCALLPWAAVQESTTRSAHSFIEHSNLIKKIRFPLETIPFSITCSAGIHMILGLGIFVVVLTVNQSLHAGTLPWVLPLFLVQCILMFGLGLIIASLNVFFRDIAQVLGILFMLFFWMTPIVYPKGRAPEGFQQFLNLNPLTHMVEAYRYVLLGSPIPSWLGLAYWAVFSLAVYFLGRFILGRLRSSLVDLL